MLVLALCLAMRARCLSRYSRVLGQKQWQMTTYFRSLHPDMPFLTLPIYL